VVHLTMIVIWVYIMAKANSLKETLGENTKITALKSEMDKIAADTAALKAGFAGRKRQSAATKEKMASSIKKAWAVLKNDSFRENAALEDKIKGELDVILADYKKKEKALDRKVADAKRQVTLKTNKAESNLTAELNKLKKLEGEIDATKTSIKGIYGKIKRILPESSKVKTLTDAELDSQVDKHLSQIFQQLIEKTGFEIAAEAKATIQSYSGDVDKVAAVVSKEKDALKKEEDKAIAELQVKFDAAKAELLKSQEQKKKQIAVMQKEYEAYIESEAKVLEKLKVKLDSDVAANNEKLEKVKLKMKKYQ